jgi:hypothetical protein
MTRTKKARPSASQGTAAERLMSKVRTKLTEHVGGNPSPVEAELIERCARLRLHLELYDAKVAGGTALSEAELKQYLAFSDVLTRALNALGDRHVALPVGDFSNLADDELAGAIVDELTRGGVSRDLAVAFAQHQIGPKRVERVILDPKLMTDEQLESERQKLVAKRSAAGDDVLDEHLANVAERRAGVADGAVNGLEDIRYLGQQIGKHTGSAFNVLDELERPTS